MSFYNYFLNLKVGKKLLIGFCGAIMITLLIAIAGVVSLKSIQDRVAKSTLSVELLNVLNEARLNRTNYEYSHQARYLEKDSQSIDKMMDIIERLKKRSWSVEGFDALQKTDDTLAGYIKERTPFLAALEEKQKNFVLLNSRGAYEKSQHASRLSQSGELDMANKLQVSQLAFILNDVDSLMGDYRARPTADLEQKIEHLLTAGVHSSQQLISTLPLTERAWLEEGIKELQTYAVELPLYLEADKYQRARSEQLDVAAGNVTLRINELLALQQQGVESRVVSAERVMIVVTLAGILFSIAMATGIARSITQPLHQTLELAEQIASGDLTRSLTSRHRDEPGLLMQAVAKMNANLQEIILKVRDGVDSIARSSSEIAAGNLDLSSRTEQQSAAVIETAASMEELTSTVALNAENARHARQLAEKAANNTGEGSQLSQQVINTMKSVRSSSHRISEITSVINSIAFQTNILALNAAVEAARAGDQGKGFAVVAGEVRSLAQRSANSAKEIESLIQESVAEVDSGFRLVERAGVVMGDIEGSVIQVRDIMSEIAAATEEQSNGIAQIALAMAEMDTTTQQNAALVEESSAAASSLEDQAVELEKVVSIFRINKNYQEKQPAASLIRSSVATQPKSPVNDASGDWTSF
ncbi:Ribose and galactose chemoreceptor protein [Cedecea lapagei]|uniref:Ribose and galactose chemoreceptor protein n=1 Tax=Cedecea lapagei TaxID=158823 RepID=A0A447V8S4_9ENTR|nr:methyl-accepting chemotaxis protein [Cedecea lapagei]VEC02174.1 Ribose and galactose chemoreceptor protein [Cedecea lapagei]